VALQISNATSPLFGLSSPAAVDLRLWSSTLAAHVNDSDPYDPATPTKVVSDLQRARQQLAAARRYCAV
jgi:hypothetical protein